MKHTTRIPNTQRKAATPASPNRSTRSRGVALDAPAIRSRITVGPAGAKQEQEADRVANQIVSTGSSTVGRPPDIQPVPVVAADHLAGSPAGGAPDASTATGGALDASTAAAITHARSGGRALDRSHRQKMESAFGTDFSGVRIHANRLAAALSRRIHASAFTVGSDIFFGGDAPTLSSRSGQRLLAHELTHVVQQRRSGQNNPADQIIRREYVDPGHFAHQGLNQWVSDEMGALIAQWDAATGEGDVQEMLSVAKRMRGQGWESTENGADSLVGQRARAAANDIAGWLVGYRAQLEKHKKHVGKVEAAVREGSGPEADLRLRNSCEWITKQKISVFVLTETADSENRAEFRGGNRVTDSAYFIGLIGGDTSGYDKEQLGDPDVQIEHRNTYGMANGKNIIALTPRAIDGGQKKMHETIRHEVQHIVDGHSQEYESLQAEIKLNYPGNPYGKMPARSDPEQHSLATYIEAWNQSRMKKALIEYRTEYRAHSYQGDPRFDELSALNELSPKESPGLPQGRHWGTRQWAIFSRIRDNYPRVAEAWGVDGQPLTPEQETFRRAVVDYRNPDAEGLNKLNSIRIGALNDALMGFDGLHDENVPDSIMFAVARLNADDRAYLKDVNQSAAFRKQVKGVLSGAALVAFWNAVRVE